MTSVATTNYVIASKTPLRPDPDDASAEVATLEAGARVVRLRDLANWSKVSFIDSSEKMFLGWLHSDLLKEAPTITIKLYNEPFGNVRELAGEIIEKKASLAEWTKVGLKLGDGTVVYGWITSEDKAPAADEQPSVHDGIAPSQEGGGDLELGPNEVYRAHLLKAQDRTDIDAAALAALIDAEATKLPTGEWNRNSTASTSSAAGLTQFLAGTWLDQAKRQDTLLNAIGKAKGYVTATDDVASGRKDDLLSLRFDPELSIVTAAEYGLFNLDALVKAGLVDDEIGDDEKARFLYLAHHEGLPGAKAFLGGTDSHTFSDLAKQVGGGRAQRYVNEASGDTTRAYKNWLNDYLDLRIRPSKFRKASAAAAVSGGDGTRALAQFDGPAILIPDLNKKVELAKAIQWRLTELGYLDPPADGKFGPVSSWALSEFCDLNGATLSGGFTKTVAQRLISPTVQLPQIVEGGNWFDKVIRYMQLKRYFICRHPDCKNIIYLEGVNTDGSLNDDAPNRFNDLRVVFSIDKSGRADFAASLWDGTTEPGRYWTLMPMNRKGAARVAFNQYKAWAVGVHHAGSPQAHEALVQVEPISVYRDLNKDFKRPGDELDTGLFGINQHWGYDASSDDLGRTSAGCLVGRTREGHRKFMEIAKSDPRYGVNRGYRFITAVMPGDEVLS